MPARNVNISIGGSHDRHHHPRRPDRPPGARQPARQRRTAPGHRPRSVTAPGRGPRGPRHCRGLAWRRGGCGQGLAAASREAVFDLVKGISCDPLRASGFCSCGWVRGSLVSGEETVMVMPLAGRVAAAVAGGLLVLVAVSSVTVTLIVSRPVNSRLTRWVDRMVDWAYEQVAARVGDYRRRDQLRATQAAAVLLAQLAAWLIVAYVGFALLLWPFATRGVVSAFTDAGSSLFTLGFAVPAGTAPAVIVFLAAATGLVILTLQIAYLPALYAAFNRRETQVALLSERAGVPSWGPELLARTHYALGTGTSTLDTMPDLYARWESWAADVVESHTTYPVLVRFRSPGPLSSWVTALLAVLDSAALFLALSPEA